MRQAETKNNILKYKEIKEEEMPNEAVKTLVDFKPENCTEKENSGLGKYNDNITVLSIQDTRVV